MMLAGTEYCGGVGKVGGATPWDGAGAGDRGWVSLTSSPNPGGTNTCQEEHMFMLKKSLFYTLLLITYIFLFIITTFHHS